MVQDFELSSNGNSKIRPNPLLKSIWERLFYTFNDNMKGRTKIFVKHKLSITN